MMLHFSGGSGIFSQAADQLFRIIAHADDPASAPLSLSAKISIYEPD